MSEISQNATATDTKNTKGRAQKKAAKTKAAVPKTKATKAKKAAKPKPERKPKAPREDRSDWQTFALRLPKSEAAQLHACSGAANASRVVRGLIAAFVAEDRAAFEAIIEDAKTLR